MNACKVNGVRSLPVKYVFRSSVVVRYYGHVLTESGLQVDEDNKVSAVLEINKPTTKEELRRFLGIVAYVAKLIPAKTVPNCCSPARASVRGGCVHGHGLHLRMTISSV